MGSASSVEEKIFRQQSGQVFVKDRLKDIQELRSKVDHPYPTEGDVEEIKNANLSENKTIKAVNDLLTKQALAQADMLNTTLNMINGLGMSEIEMKLFNIKLAQKFSVNNKAIKNYFNNDCTEEEQNELIGKDLQLYDLTVADKSERINLKKYPFFDLLSKAFYCCGSATTSSVLCCKNTVTKIAWLLDLLETQYKMANGLWAKIIRLLYNCLKYGVNPLNFDSVGYYGLTALYHDTELNRADIASIPIISVFNVMGIPVGGITCLVLKGGYYVILIKDLIQFVLGIYAAYYQGKLVENFSSRVKDDVGLVNEAVNYMYHFGIPTAYNMTRSFHEFLSDTESNTTISKIKDVLLRENVTVSSDSIVSEILTVIAKDTRDMLVEMKNSVLGYVTQGALDMGKEGYDMLMEKIENDPKAMKILNGGQIIYNVLDNMGQMMLGVDNGFTKVQKLTQNSMFKFAIDNTLGEGVIKSINDMGDVLKLSPEERMALENPIKQEQRKYNLDGIIDLNTYDQPEMPPLEIGYKFEKKEKKIRTVRK